MYIIVLCRIRFNSRKGPGTIVESISLYGHWSLACFIFEMKIGGKNILVYGMIWKNVVGIMV